MDKQAAENFIIGTGLTGSNADRVRAQADSDQLKFYIVENSAGRLAYYLAESGTYAKHLAAIDGQVEHIWNAKVFTPKEVFWKDQVGFRGAIKRAVAAGKPGPVQKRDQFAILGDKVFAPIAEAE